jgi:hypothetical protein
MAEADTGPLCPALVVADRRLAVNEVCQRVNPLLDALCHHGTGPTDLLGIARVSDPATLVGGDDLPLTSLSGEEARWYLCHLAPSVGTGDRAILSVTLSLLPRGDLHFAPALEDRGPAPDECDWLLARLEHGLGERLDPPVRWDRRHCRLLTE